MNRNPATRSARRLNAEYAVDLSKWRVWRDGEGDAPPQPPAPPPDAPQGGNGSGEGDSPSWLPERLKRAQEKARQEERERLFKELGIEDPEGDKELLTAARKRKQDEMSEADKAKTELAKEQATRARLEAELAEERATRRLERRDNALRDALRNAQARNVDKTFAVLASLKKADVDAVLADDGTVDSKKVAALVEAAKKDYAEDFGPVRTIPGTGSHANAGRVAGKQPPKVRTSGSI